MPTKNKPSWDPEVVVLGILLVGCMVLMAMKVEGVPRDAFMSLVGALVTRLGMKKRKAEPSK